MARKSKFSEADIIGAIKEIEGGATATATARKAGVSMQTMQRWRAKIRRNGSDRDARAPSA
jgi:transposase-like protein